MASSEVCVLDPLRAELYEAGTIPQCQFHKHVSKSVAAAMVGDDDGYGSARRLQPQRLPDTAAFDRKERIEVLPRVIRWRSKPAWMDETGARGPSVMLPVFENLR